MHSNCKNISVFAKSLFEIVKELPRLTAAEREEILLQLTALNTDGWLEQEEPLTVRDKAVLEARLVTYKKDPEAGSSWNEVEERIHSLLRA